MVIFHSYVSLPEGIQTLRFSVHLICPFWLKPTKLDNSSRPDMTLDDFRCANRESPSSNAQFRERPDFFGFQKYDLYIPRNSIYSNIVTIPHV